MYPCTTGRSTPPGRFLFLPELISISCWNLVSLACCFLQYLHVPWAGVPVQVTPKSFGRFANAPQVVHSHLSMPCSTTLSAEWFAERSPLVTFLAARWSHFLRWKLDFHFSRLVFFLVLHGNLTSLFQPR